MKTPKKRHTWISRFLVLSLSLSLGAGLSGCDLLEALLLPGDIPDSGKTTDVSRPVSTDANTTVATPVDAGSASHHVQEDLMEATTEFDVHFEPGQASVIQAVRLDPSQMPSNLNLADFRLERWQAAQGQWVPEGFPMTWDASSGEVTFEIGNPESGNFSVGAFHTQQSSAYRYRVRVYIFSNILTVRREGSPFQIHYYPSNLGYADSVKKDAVWSGSGQASEERIPDFVEDLDLALNQAYTRLLQIQLKSGQPLFKKLAEPIDVYIRNTGSAAGNSPLGGPAVISNLQITDWEDLQRVTTHELVHVLQGQYYTLSGLLTGRANRWFIEAMAEYFTVRTLGLGDTGKKEVYGDLLADYLGVPLNSSSDGSMYAAGHFLNWASDQISLSLVPDALAHSSANDAVSLSSQIRAQSSYSGLGEALINYLHWVNTHPEADGGFNADVKGKLQAFHIAAGTWPKVNLVFTNDQTYIPLDTSLNTLSVLYGEFLARNDDKAMLVMDASAVSNDSSLRSRTYDRVGTSSSDYPNPLSLEGSMDLSVFTRKSITIPNFGKTAEHTAAEQWILNDSMTTAMPLKIRYYLLRTPQITEQLDGKVTWSTQAVKQIPAELLDSYAVYLNNHLLEEGLAVERSKAEQSYENPAIRAKGLPVTVTIKDHLGNIWPEMQAEQISFELLNNPFPLGMAVMAPGSSVTLEYRVNGVKNPEVRWTVSTMSLEGGSEAGTLTTAPGRVTFTAAPGVAGAVNLVGTLVQNDTMIFMQMISIIPDMDKVFTTP